jgi:hypothetical protein
VVARALATPPGALMTPLTYMELEVRTARSTMPSLACARSASLTHPTNTSFFVFCSRRQGKAGPDGVRPPSWPDDEDDGDDSDAEYADDQLGTPLLDAASFGSSPPVTPRVVSAPSSWALAGAGSVNGGTPGSSGSGGSSRGVPLTEVCHPQQQQHASGGGSDWQRRTLDLREYINRSNVSVPESFSAQRTYLLFRTLGLRHLPVRRACAWSTHDAQASRDAGRCIGPYYVISDRHCSPCRPQVVNERSCVVGMVTRKELLHDRLNERLQASAGDVGVSRGSTPPNTPTAQHRGERSALLASP